MDYLPLFFNLRGRKVLLVGGGKVALRKARLLSRAGASLQVVALSLQPELEQLLKTSKGQWLASEYQPEHLRQVDLVVAATDDTALHQRLFAACQAQNLPINVVDTPELCSFIFPALVDRSPILIGISSGGKAPVLARLLRARLESIIPTRYSELAELAGRFRAQVKQRLATLTQRRKFWEKVLTGPIAERVLSGQMAEAQTSLQQELDLTAAELEAATSPAARVGEVYLVGAGPGDPELLTFKALRLMQQADVVLYDRLVAPAILDLCRRDADLIYVGKKRDLHTLPQEEINRLLVDKALAGYRVVRLKGGDPFIFGRGGEELAELKAAGVPFQVVPGITAASACAAYAGIPLTHRDYAQSVRFITGQLKNRTSSLDFASMLSPDQTLVFYMGLHTLELLVQGLLEAGKPATTPIAIIAQGSTPQQQVLTSTLAEVLEHQAVAQLPAPAIILVGQVVKLQQQLAWFNTADLLASLNSVSGSFN